MELVPAKSFGAQDAYALGLWCADGYHRSSSIGLSNVDPELIRRFAAYLVRELNADRLRIRIYKVEGAEPDPSVLALTSKVSVCRAHKMKRIAYHVYVNCRPLLRRFRSLRDGLGQLHADVVAPYMAGRFDGDGAVGRNRVPGTRIAYSTRDEAEIDAQLLSKIGLRELSIYDYADAGETCIYLKAGSNAEFLDLIRPYSATLTPKLMRLRHTLPAPPAL